MPNVGSRKFNSAVRQGQVNESPETWSNSIAHSGKRQRTTPFVKNGCRARAMMVLACGNFPDRIRIRMSRSVNTTWVKKPPTMVDLVAPRNARVARSLTSLHWS